VVDGNFERVVAAAAVVVVVVVLFEILTDTPDFEFVVEVVVDY
jgi:hypothetical protein